MAAKRFVEVLNAQIGSELSAHNQYVACAAYCDGLTMPQMAGCSTARRSRSGATR